MFEMNGYVYAGSTAPVLKIIHAQALEGHWLLAQFSNGAIRRYDFSPNLALTVYKPLRDEELFQAMRLERGVPTWLDGSVDIAPEEIYEGGEALNEWPEALAETARM